LAPDAARLYKLRLLADKLNERREFQTYGVEAVKAGTVVAADLLTEILRYIADYYCQEQEAGALEAGLSKIRLDEGALLVDKPKRVFVELFPPESVREGKAAPEVFVTSASEGRTNEEVIAREMALLHVALANPAMAPLHQLYQDDELKHLAPYEPLIHNLEAYFDKLPTVAELDTTLFETLRAPSKANPDSLEAQLEFIRTKWGKLLPKRFLHRITRTVDIIHEEHQMRGFGPGPPVVPRFGLFGADVGYPEYAAFSADADWMSNVVLLAKTVYVWLDQLSRKYQHPIQRLDEVPAEELEELAQRGFNGLWLIGVWERSPASQQIKQIMGNPEAAASAYSLYDYVIAADLGGEEAYLTLRDRAGQRGIRLASDMVPNHVGIYSRWTVEHPDWFVQLEYPPFPSYSFTGENLSQDGRVGMYLEDGYWDHRDAAVVFKHVEHGSGRTRYIYHGNDGTHMPWNDTAQLNFLIAEVREAVIQTILHVARKFSIIRFDAAMTLAKRHYHRLWFPQPGDAGAIPSRAEHGLSKEAFDKAMPQEFWREVVDRIAAEVPDTLLLAEAFWLMEGYFVRTLGMHRVYNSAFMNMLKLEENAKYRQTMKNVLEFSPEVLKRFVNFINNPDEATAVEQFGKGDKYFGVCVLMATLPGLPMFGHGQVEGFSEKYGMEYRRAYWDEPVDEQLVWRHEREIFPLLRQRRIFSGVDHFALYDFYLADGSVNDNVYAYSNRYSDARSIVLFNNTYESTAGWIRLSSPLNVGEGDTVQLIERTLRDSLELEDSEHIFYILRDSRSGMEYLRQGRRLVHEGLYVELQGYQYYVFHHFREVIDTDGTWNRLFHQLAGAPVPDMARAYRELALQNVTGPFHRLFSKEHVELLCGRLAGPPPGKKARRAGAGSKHTAAISAELEEFLAMVKLHEQSGTFAGDIIEPIEEEFRVIAQLAKLLEAAGLDESIATFLAEHVPPEDADPTGYWRIPVLWVLLRRLGALRSLEYTESHSMAMMDDLYFTKGLAQLLESFELEPYQAEDTAALVRFVVGHGSGWKYRALGGPEAVVHWLVDSAGLTQYLRVNRHDGALWVHKEALERLLYWLVFAAAVTDLVEPYPPVADSQQALECAVAVLAAAGEASYRVDAMHDLLGQPVA
jgi:glycosidase